MKLILSNGAEIDIIDNSPESGGGELYADTDLVKDLNASFSPVVQFAHDTLEQLKAGIAPKELEITFGAEAGGEGGFFGIARAHAKATVLVKMKWTT